MTHPISSHYKNNTQLKALIPKADVLLKRTRFVLRGFWLPKMTKMNRKDSPL